MTDLLIIWLFIYRYLKSRDKQLIRPTAIDPQKYDKIQNLNKSDLETLHSKRGLDKMSSRKITSNLRLTVFEDENQNKDKDKDISPKIFKSIWKKLIRILNNSKKLAESEEKISRIVNRANQAVR